MTQIIVWTNGDYAGNGLNFRAALKQIAPCRVVWKVLQKKGYCIITQ